MAGDISRENGKKGGRKKGLASIKAEEARNLLAQMVFDEITPLARRLIDKAKMGDVAAFKELFDRAFGKAPQAIDLTTKGDKLIFDDKQIGNVAREVVNGGGGVETQPD